jgi:hypothetical protein
MVFYRPALDRRVLDLDRRLVIYPTFAEVRKTGPGCQTLIARGGG